MVVTQCFPAWSLKMFHPKQNNWELLCDLLCFRTLKSVAMGKHLIMIISNGPEAAPRSFCVSHWRCFLNATAQHQKPKAVAAILLKNDYFVGKYFISYSIQWICNGYLYAADGGSLIYNLTILFLEMYVEVTAMSCVKGYMFDAWKVPLW